MVSHYKKVALYWVSWLLLFDGLVAVLYFPEIASKKLRVDENALQPTFAKVQMGENWNKAWSRLEYSFRKALKKSQLTHKQDSNAHIKADIIEWLSGEWRSQRLEVYPLEMKSTANGSDTRNGKETVGVYGIWRSPSSDGQMSTILSLQLSMDSLNTAKPPVDKSLSSLSAFTALTGFLTTVNWCSKDLAFVLVFVSEKDYYDSRSNLFGSSGNKESTTKSTTASSGVKRKKRHRTHLVSPKWSAWSESLLDDGMLSTNAVGALHLDIPLYYDALKSKKKSAVTMARDFDLWLETVNPQPNLDVVASATTVFSRVNIELAVAPLNWWQWHTTTSTTQKSTASGSRKRKRKDESESEAMAYHMIGQLLTADRAHRIDVTSIHSENGVYSAQRMVDIMRGCELWVRCMSNLIERLHHATYHYLLVSNHKFVTMAHYFPALALLMCAPALYGLISLKELPTVIIPMQVETGQVHNGGAVAVQMPLVLLSVSAALGLSYFSAVFLIIAWPLMLWFGTELLEYDYFAPHSLFTVLVSVFTVFAQFWVPLCINFAAGFLSMTISVLMLLLFVLGNPQFEEVRKQSKTAAMAVALFKLAVWCVFPFAVIYTLTFAIDFERLPDLLDSRHPFSVVFAVVLIPIYLMSLFFVLQRLYLVSRN